MKNNKRLTIPKYATGGWWDRNKSGIGGFAADAGMFMANNIAMPVTGTLGLGTVSDMVGYDQKTKLGEMGNKAQGIQAGIYKSVAPMAANAVAPGSGALISPLQQGAGQLNQSMNPYMNDPNQGQMMGQQIGGMGAQAFGMAGSLGAFAYGGRLPRYNMGGLIEYNGPSHANGGIPVDINGMPTSRPNAVAEVEGGETKKGNYIFSDRLKPEGSKKTFAELSKAIERKYKGKTDKLATSSKEAEMARLQQSNDQVIQAKETKEVNRFMKKYGGRLPMYNGGGTFDPLDMETSWRQAMSPTSMPTIGVDAVNPNIAAQNPQTIPLGVHSQVNNKNPYAMIGLQAANLGIQNFGNFRDIYTTKWGKNYDKVNYGSVNPNLLSDQAAMQDADMQSRVAAKQLANASNGHSGSYLASRSALAGETMRAKGAIRENFENMNAGIKNQFAQYNKGLQMQGMVDEAQNKARSEDITRQALNNIGQNVGGQTGDVLAYGMDKKRMNLLKDYMANYTYDPSTGGWVPKSTGSLFPMTPSAPNTPTSPLKTSYRNG